MLLDDPNRDPVEILAEIYTARLRDGSTETIEQFADEYSDYRQDILDLFPTILNLENLKKEQSKSGPVPALVSVNNGDRLGDFLIEREIARGGMGVVYLAKQQSLGRSVALKILSRSLSSNDRQVIRFQKEAMAAANLHHTNIVPVFGVGTDKDLHFYAMQLIEGSGLDDVIKNLRIQCREDLKNAAGAETEEFSETIGTSPESTVQENTKKVPAWILENLLLGIQDGVSVDAGGKRDDRRPLGQLGGISKTPKGDRFQPAEGYWKSVASIGLQVADALGYAHRNSITHRDIKPGNILIDHQLNVWVTDFGLAKQQSLGDFTQTGEVLGTFRYMAPEQFEGKLDSRSDLHSLGLTLYEICCLRPAFSGNNHADLIRKKTTRSVRPLSELVPTIPVDLETIILKCCSVHVQDRYKNADELMEDLRRFLTDQPILARKTSSVERISRWVKRNPVLALTTASTFVLLFAVSVLSIGAFVLTNNALDREKAATVRWRIANNKAEKKQEEAEQKQIEATKAQQLATSNLQLALKAFDRIFQNVSSRGVPQSLVDEMDPELVSAYQVQLNSEDKKLLQMLLTFYQKFSEENQNAPTLMQKNAFAFLRMSQIDTRLGRHQDAMKSVDQGIEKLATVLSENETDSGLLSTYYALLNQKGRLELVLESKMPKFLKQNRWRDRKPGEPDLPKSHLLVIQDAKARKVNLQPDNEVIFQIAQAYYLLGSCQIREHQEAGTFSFEPENGRKGDGKPGGGKPGEGKGRGGRGREDKEFRGRGRPFRGGKEFGGRRNEGWKWQKDWEDKSKRRFKPPASLGEFDFPYVRGPLYDIEVSIWLYSTVLKDQDASDKVVLARSHALQNRFLMIEEHFGHQEADASFLEALQFTRESLVGKENSPALKASLADLLSLSIRNLNKDSGQRQRSQVKKYLDEAAEISKGLANEFPSLIEYQVLHATALRNRGRLDLAEKNFQKAEEYFDKAVGTLSSIEEHLVENSTIYQTTLAICKTDLASAILADSRRDLNVPEVRRAMNHLRESFQMVEPMKMQRRYKDPLLHGICLRLEDGYKQLKQFDQAEEVRHRSKRFQYGSPRRPFFDFGHFLKRKE